MDSFAKMDIFFMVTTGAVVLVTLLGVVILLFVLKILNDLREITAIARREAAEFAKDLDEVRADIKEGVADVREAVGYGLKTAKAASGAASGAGLLRTLTNVVQSFSAEKRSTKRRTRKKSDE